MSLNRTGQQTNEDIITPKKEHWQAQVRNSFKLTITVTCQHMLEATIMKFQKQVEDLAVEKFQGGTVQYKLE